MEPLTRGRMLVALSQKMCGQKRLASSSPKTSPKRARLCPDEGNSINTSTAMVSHIVDQCNQSMDISIDSAFLDPNVSFTELENRLQISPSSEETQELPPPPQWMLTDLESSQSEHVPMPPPPPEMSPSFSNDTTEVIQECDVQLSASPPEFSPSLSSCEFSPSSVNDTPPVTETSVYRHVNDSFKRLKGDTYTCRVKDKESGKVTQVSKPRRDLGARCQCTASWRKCAKVTDVDRTRIFQEFWALNSWEAKKLFVKNLVTVTRKDNEQKTSFRYSLQVSDGALEVCKVMFLNTLSIGEWSARNWCLQQSVIAQPKLRQSWYDRGKDQAENCKEFLKKLNKVPSHYCRKSTNKEYLERNFRSIQDVFVAYTGECSASGTIPLSRQAFSRIFNNTNIGIFMPRKDQCDTCVAHEKGTISESEWNTHREKKEEAQNAKSQDKSQAENDKDILVFSMDLQAVLLSPATKASALYYKTKLQVHNFTIFEFTKKEVDCFVWHESDGGVTSAEFASCILCYLNMNAKGKKLIQIYSDGCCYQNRNVNLSKVLTHFAMKEKTVVEQKFLEKGHTQMECDSVHALIERKLRGRDIYSPSDYVRLIKEARKSGRPYNVHYIDHTFFKDFSKLSALNSIRPGRKVGDAKVTDLRGLRYEPNGTILFKLRHTEDWKELPKQRNEDYCPDQISDLYQQPVKITKQKYKDLQDMKAVLPKDVHGFYDQLPHQ